MFQSDLIFSIQTSKPEQYKAIFHSEINSLAYNGNGGYNWDTVYRMPIFARRLSIKFIKDQNARLESMSAGKTKKSK